MSADEIDAELLAMAGDSSDEEADDLDQLHDTEERISNDGEQAESGVHRTTEAPLRTKGVAQKVKARGRRQRKRSESDIEDENDLDRSPSPAMSSDAGALDESDADSDGAGDYDEEAPLFPLEGKFENARDREIIMAMNEIEREEVLADRAAQVLRRQQDIQLKKALADGRASASKQKRKALAAELDEGARRNTRPKTDKRSALDDYRRAREQKGAERSRTDQHRRDRDDFSPSGRSDNDAEGESEVEWADPVSDSRREETPAELKDFERCRVGRSNFAKVCFYPGFEDAIKGCFCRVNIGPNKENGQAQYRMTQIKGFTEGRPYSMETSAGKRFITDQFAIVAQGADEKPFPFSACSDGHFTDAEFSRFQETMSKANLRVPSRKLLASKLERIHGLLNTNFTEDTLQLKFNKQRSMQLKYDPVNIARTKRESIEQRRREAQDSGDLDEVEKCDAELAALHNSSTVTIGAKPKASPATNAHNLDRLAKLNAKNRGKTVQEVRQALVEERRKLQREREEAALKKAQAAAEAAEAQASASKKAAAVKQGSATSNRATPVAAENGHGAIGALKRQQLDDDVIGSLDLGIDLEI